MQRKIILLLIFCAVAFSAFTQKTIAIKCGSLFDAKAGTMLANQVVVVKGNIIQSITAAASFKDKVDSTIDLSGYTVLPGLIDAHTHVLLQQDITTKEYADQLLQESIPYRTLRAVRSARISLQNG